MRLALVLLWICLPTIGYAGGRAGNGFALECRDDKEHGLKAGYYSLDYLATKGLGPAVKVRTWKESAERIRKRLKGALSNKQLALYDDFVATVRNDDYTKTRVWEAAPFGVLNLKTEASPEQPGKDPLHKEQLKTNLQSLVQKVPDACSDTKGGIGLIPAVVFQDSFFTGRPDGYLVYKFVPKVLDSLEVNDPLQLSYLYIHEWLWDISNNEDRNRRINHLLHSEKGDVASTGEVRKQLKGMGLELRTESPDGETKNGGGVRPKTGLPDLESGDLEETYRATEIPERLFGVATIRKQLMKGEAVIQMGPYKVHTLSRRCPKGGSCTPWKKVNAVWNDLVRKHAVPEGGEVFLRRESNLTLIVKTDPVKVDGGKGRIVATECSLDHADKASNNGTCRKMWGPEGDFKPIGHLWVDETSPDLVATFTKTHLWIGAHAKRGDVESRIAIVVPYAEDVQLNGDEDGA